MNTKTNPTNLAGLLATIEARHADLVKLHQDGLASGFAIKCGPMCIAVNDGKANACGVEQATRYTNRAQAARIAATITNGNGDVGRVMPYQDALADEIASTTAALDALRQAAKAQA